MDLQVDVMENLGQPMVSPWDLTRGGAKGCGRTNSDMMPQVAACCIPEYVVQEVLAMDMIGCLLGNFNTRWC